jgi:hypothetical protein
MSQPTEWHASADIVERFATDPRTLDSVVASSLEAHLLQCAACRQAVHDAADAERQALAASWDRVADRIDRPKRSLVERLLERLGISGGVARLVAATPALRLTGLAAVLVVAAAAVLAARSTDAIGPFLVVAPLAPLGAVAAAFAATADPAGEAGVATPLHGAGLALRRATAVLTTTFVVLAVASLALPVLDLEVAAWIFPGLALSLGALALGTRWRPEVAAGVLGGGWVLAVMAAELLARTRTPVAETAVFEPIGQLVAVALSIAAAAVLVARRDMYATVEVRQ